MNVIWKFPLDFDVTVIEAPVEEFLTVQVQNDKPCVWGIVNPDRAPKKIKIYILGTGWECQKIDASKYIGTVQDSAGCVWHCFWENVVVPRSPNESVFALFSSR